MVLEDYLKNQLQKRKKRLSLGETPYPLGAKRTHTIAEADKNFEVLLRTTKEVILAGRIKSIRRHGGGTFCHLQDGTGFFQFLMRRDGVGAKAYQEISHMFDEGDVVEARGTLFLTKRKERTLQLRKIRLLAKALRPFPEKWHGLQDVEERYRKRYLDLFMNSEIREKFLLRSKIFIETRAFFEKAGFQEVETPVLQQLPGGASARPFKTHLNALDLNLYLRVSPELYLKRLLVGGMEKVFEIGRCFRNEGIDHAHNPDFTMLEAYWAYADYKELMKFSEKFITSVVRATGKGLVREYGGKKINFKTPWPRVEFTAFLKKYAGVDYEDLNRDALAKKAKKLGLSIGPHATKAQIADEMYKKVCLPNVEDPIFIIHHPAELTPLAKTLEDRPQYAARFQALVAGWELVNAFSELNDPVLQKERFVEQEKQRKQGDEEAQRLDMDFIEALEYGMPPAAGFGMGMDRFAALLADSHSLREIILFPTMKPKN